MTRVKVDPTSSSDFTLMSPPRDLAMHLLTVNPRPILLFSLPGVVLSSDYS